MLWIYIDNTGSARCVVNVGNKIRQGNGFKVFVCFQGEANSGNSYADTAIYGLRDLYYIKPTTSNLTHYGVSVSAEETEQTFLLGTPSQANSYFQNNVTYRGWLVELDGIATTFTGEGGHIMLLPAVFEKAHSDDYSKDFYAQNLSVFIEPTYGIRPPDFTLTDYDTIMARFKDTTSLNLGVIDDLSELDGYRYQPATPDHPTEGVPYAFYSLQYEDKPCLLFVTYDDDTGTTTQQLVLFDDGTTHIYAESRTYSSGGWSEWDYQYSNPIINITQVRTTDANGLTKNVVTFHLDNGVDKAIEFYDGVGLKNITQETIPDTYGRATNRIGFVLTDGTTKYATIKDGVGIRTVSQNRTTDANGLATNTVVIYLTDGTSKTMSITDGVGVDSITASESAQDGGTNVVYIHTTDGNTASFNVRNGRQGSPLLGNVGFTFMVVSGDSSSPYYYGTLGLTSAEVGHLVLAYPDGTSAPGIYLVSDDPSSPSYYGTLGVDAGLVGHLVYIG